MPLIESGSNEALQSNIATEIESGKSPEQASAIGYSVQAANDNNVPVYQMEALSTLQNNVPVHELAAKSVTYGGNNSGNFGVK